MTDISIFFRKVVADTRGNLLVKTIPFLTIMSFILMAVCVAAGPTPTDFNFNMFYSLPGTGTSQVNVLVSDDYQYDSYPTAVEVGYDCAFFLQGPTTPFYPETCTSVFYLATSAYGFMLLNPPGTGQDYTSADVGAQQLKADRWTIPIRSWDGTQRFAYQSDSFSTTVGTTGMSNSVYPLRFSYRCANAATQVSCTFFRRAWGWNNYGSGIPVANHGLMSTVTAPSLSSAALGPLNTRGVSVGSTPVSGTVTVTGTVGISGTVGVSSPSPLNVNVVSGGGGGSSSASPIQCNITSWTAGTLPVRETAPVTTVGVSAIAGVVGVLGSVTITNPSIPVTIGQTVNVATPPNSILNVNITTPVTVNAPSTVIDWSTFPGAFSSYSRNGGVIEYYQLLTSTQKDEWALSRKARNKLKHSENGNTSLGVAVSTLKAFTALFKSKLESSPNRIASYNVERSLGAPHLETLPANHLYIDRFMTQRLAGVPRMAEVPAEERKQRIDLRPDDVDSADLHKKMNVARPAPVSAPSSSVVGSCISARPPSKTPSPDRPNASPHTAATKSRPALVPSGACVRIAKQCDTPKKLAHWLVRERPDPDFVALILRSTLMRVHAPDNDGEGMWSELIALFARGADDFEQLCWSLSKMSRMGAFLKSHEGLLAEYLVNTAHFTNSDIVRIIDSLPPTGAVQPSSANQPSSGENARQTPALTTPPNPYRDEQSCAFTIPPPLHHGSLSVPVPSVPAPEPLVSDMSGAILDEYMMVDQYTTQAILDECKESSHDEPVLDSTVVAECYVLYPDPVRLASTVSGMDLPIVAVSLVGKRYSMVVSRSDTVADVYSAILFYMGLAPEDYRLRLCGTSSELAMGESVVDFLAEEGFVFDVTPNLKGGSAVSASPLPAGWVAENFSQVSSSASLDSEPSGDAPSISPERLDSRLTGTGGALNMASFLPGYSGNLRLRVINTNNTIWNGGQPIVLQRPEHGFMPRQFRLAGAGFEEPFTRTSWELFTAKPLTHKGSYTLTAAAMFAESAALENRLKSQSVIPTCGVRAEEFARVATTVKTLTSLAPSILSLCTKAALYHKILAFRETILVGTTRSVSLTGLAKIDLESAVSPTQVGATVQLNVPGMAGANEEWGGINDPIWGFDPNADLNGKGELTFHQSLATVADPLNMLFVPSQILQAPNPARSPSLNIAVYLMLMAPYPFGMYMFNMITSSNAGVLDSQKFHMLANHIYIPGHTTIAVLLPIKHAQPQPANQANAQMNVQCVPTAGPVPTAMLAANAMLDVSWESPGNGGYAQYSLVDFLVSWWTQITPSLVLKIAQLVAEGVNRRDDLWAGWELAHALSNRYSPLTLAAIDTVPTKLLNNRPVSTVTVNCVGQTVPDLAAAFPLTVVRPSWVIPTTEFLHTSMSLMGVVTIPGETGSYTHSLSQLFDVYTNYAFSFHITRAYAALTTLSNRQLGVPVALWTSLAAGMPFTVLRELMSGYFVGEHCVGDTDFQVALQSSRLRDLAAHWLGCKPTASTDGLYLLSLRYWSDTTVGVYDPAIAGYRNGYVPVLLTDPWLYYALSRVPKELQTWSPPAAPDNHGFAASGDLRVEVLSAGATVPTYSGHLPRNIANNEVAVSEPRELYNGRLARLAQTGAGLYTWAAVAPAGTAVNPGVGAFYSTFGYPTWRPDAFDPMYYARLTPLTNTGYQPLIDSNGATVVTAVIDAANGAAMMSRFNGTAFFALSTALYVSAGGAPTLFYSSGAASVPSYLRPKLALSAGSVGDAQLRKAAENPENAEDLGGASSSSSSSV